MKIIGIVAEYNPFHNGHAWQIAQARRMSGCDCVIAVMDGHFTQRGEAACLSKWDRARAALLCGADAVFELPALYAVRSADVFARGGVGILAALGADGVSFGCEPEGIGLISDLAEILRAEPEPMRRALQGNLAEGKSHARAWGEACAAYLGVDAALLNQPNLILAAQYVRAIRELKPEMAFVAVPRIGGYHDGGLSEIASASAIRRAASEGRIREAEVSVPLAARGMLWGAAECHAADDLMLHILRTTPTEAIGDLPEASEGIEARLSAAARRAATLEEAIDQTKCRRYTRARIQRMCAQAALGLTRPLAAAHPAPEYARLTGLRRDAAPLMKELSQRSALKIVSDGARLRENPVFQLECRATELWALGRNRPEERIAGREFTEKFVTV